MSIPHIIMNVWNLINDDINWDTIWDILFSVPIKSKVDISTSNKIIINILKSLLELNLFNNASDGIISMIKTIVKYINNNKNPFKNNIVLLDDIMNIFNQYKIDKSQLLFLRLPDDTIFYYSQFVLNDVYKIILSNKDQRFNNLQWIEFLKTPNAKEGLLSNKTINNYYIQYNYYNYWVINDDWNISYQYLIYDMYNHIIMNNNDLLLDHFIDVWNGDFYELWNDDIIVSELTSNPSDKILDLIHDDVVDMYRNNSSFWVGLSKNTNIKAINILINNFDNYFNFFIDDETGLFITGDDNMRLFSLLLQNPTALDFIWKNWDYFNMILDNDIIINLLAKNPHDDVIKYIIDECNIIIKDHVFWENLAYNNNDKALKLIVDNWSTINKSSRFWEMLAENTNDKALQLITDNLLNIKSNVDIWLSLAQNNNRLAFNLILENWNYIMDIMNDQLLRFFIYFSSYQPVFEIDVEETNSQKEELNIIYNRIRSDIL